MKLQEYIKRIIKEELLLEALTLSKAKEMTSIKRNPSIQQQLDSIFKKLQSSTKTTASKRGDRIYIPFGTDTTITSTENSEITSFLEKNGYKIKDYKTGLCIDSYGRELKIGKVLTKLNNSELLKKFTSDKTRESSKNVNSYMVFSKHPYDISGASTDRGWTSCMNLYTGSNKRYIQKDIELGSFIVYLVSGNDLNIQKPIARSIIKPYIDINDESNVLYSADKIYGTAPQQFKETIDKILSSIQGEKVGNFKFVEELYNDDLPSRITKFPKYDGTIESLEILCNAVFGKNNWSFNSKNEIDLKVSATVESLKHFIVDGKLIFPFGTVNGNFICRMLELKTLLNFPHTITGDFNIAENKLTSLVHSPTKVGGYYDCSKNFLITLTGAPKIINKNFYCSLMNKLESLYGAPRRVNGSFFCTNNHHLKSLEGSPNFVGNAYAIYGNKSLTSLKGISQKIGGDLEASNCDLESLEYAPSKIGGFVDFTGNPKLNPKEIQAYKLSIM